MGDDYKIEVFAHGDSYWTNFTYVINAGVRLLVGTEIVRSINLVVPYRAALTIADVIADVRDAERQCVAQLLTDDSLPVPARRYIIGCLMQMELRANG